MGNMETLVGNVTHYFGHLGVAVLDLSGELEIGDMIYTSWDIRLTWLNKSLLWRSSIIKYHRLGQA